jgi:hypothetical protein
MFAFQYYGSNFNCNSHILSKMLDINCAPEHDTWRVIIALKLALKYYGTNPNCDSHILLKMLDMDCIPRQIGHNGRTALVYTFQYYGNNPNYDPNVFLKLISLLQSLITRSKLIEVLNKNTNNQNLKNNIMKVYLYNSRRTIINSRISKRVFKGKYDSLSIFN